MATCRQSEISANRLPASICLLLAALVVSFPTAADAQGTITFQFSGVVRYEQSNPIPDLAVGDQFSGFYTFNSLASGTPVTDEGTIDTLYANAVTSWSVSVPSRALTFAGTTGRIGVGNDAPWYKSDRYIVTLYPDAGSRGVPSGAALTYFQIDLFRYGWGSGSPLLQDSSIQATPPDMALVLPGDSTGHFMFDAAQYQTWTQTLTAVPEPSSLALFVLSLGGLARRSYVRQRA